jgi:hypothetical protein
MRNNTIWHDLIDKFLSAELFFFKGKNCSTRREGMQNINNDINNDSAAVNISSLSSSSMSLNFSHPDTGG